MWTWNIGLKREGNKNVDEFLGGRQTYPMKSNEENNSKRLLVLMLFNFQLNCTFGPTTIEQKEIRSPMH